MDIKKEIERLRTEKVKQESIKLSAHDEIKKINSKIGKLETVLKNAGEILFEDGEEKEESEAVQADGKV